MATPIVKNFVTDFGAVGDGTTDNSPAVDRWLAWAKTQGTAPIELYMPPLTYHFAGNDSLTDGLYNVTISAYGATVDSLFIGTRWLLQNNFDHSARIQTVSAGATSLDLITPADASKFSVGQWVLVSGLSLQGGIDLGYPPNFQFFEYKQITNISGSLVTLADPLANSYKSTWPVVENDLVEDMGGPATIFALAPTFDAEQTILGLKVTAEGAVFMSAGRSLILDGMTFDGEGPAASIGQSVVIRNTAFGQSNEIDKLVSYLEYDNSTGYQLTIQSATPETLVIKGSTIASLNGTAQNTFIENSTIGDMKTGPLAYGVGESISIVNSNISTSLISDVAIDPSILVFNSGTFRIATGSTNANEVYRWAVPGHEYFFAYYYGDFQIHDDTGNVTEFKILDVRQDATYIYVDTDLGAALPSPTFLGGNAANQLVAYPVMSLTVTNSGPADLVDTIWSPEFNVFAPTITSNGGGDTAAVSIAENTTAVTTVTATDPDVGQTLSYSIIGGADASKFTIGSTTGALSFVTAPNFELPTDAGGNNVYDVIVQVSDGHGGIDTQAIAVTVTDVFENSAPIITSNGGGDTAALSIAENATAVTTVTATDPDAGQTLSYSISGGADASKFTIDSTTGALSFVTAPNFELPTDAGGNNVYDVTVQVSDGHGGIDTQAIAVTVTDVFENSAPIITSNGGGDTAAISIAENTTAVTTVTATDPDAGQTLSYSISGGADASKFTIDSSTGALSFVTAPNFELPTDAGGNNVYDVTVRVSDGNGGIDTQAIAVTVTDVFENSAPTITSNGGGDTAAISIAENTTAVTTVTATDPDAGQTLSYSITGGADASKFTISSTTGALSFVTAPNFELPTDAGGNNVYDVIVRASDGKAASTRRRSRSR